MSFNIVVLAKQVPDTRNVGKDAMTPQGTVNRAALPAIFNPEDLNALELALRIKDAHPGTKIQIVTMGLPKAAEVIREGLFRGTDGGVLVTDRALAGADTLATSYVLAQTIRKMGHVDLVIGGRQAIDGDTAQVGPQVAQKLDIDQVTYVEQVEELDEKSVTVTRRIDGGVERVKAPLPVLLTVTGSAAPCRPRNAKLMMKYKRALAPAEQKADMPYAEEYARKPYLTITQWGAADIDADITQCGLAGSPTKVKTVQNVVFATKESRTLTGSDADVEQLIVELLDSHTIG
jgi:electron transfer flavoprotein, beta subunit